MKEKTDKVKELIEIGKEVKEKNYQNSDFMPAFISGNEYNVWMNNIKIFADRYLRKHSCYDEIIEAHKTRNNCWGTSAYDNMMSYLQSIYDDSEFWEKYEKESYTVKEEDRKIFISHSTSDIAYVGKLVELLEFIGLRSRNELFCSSLSGYDIPSGKNIYDYLRNQFDKELFVILLLSKNYYNSPACLNEMGATWVKALDHYAILVPDFEYSSIKGAINASEVCFRINDKFRINELKERVIDFFKLGDIENNRWEERRDSIINDINDYYEQNKYIAKEIEVYFQGIRPLQDDEYEIILRIENNTKRDLEIIRITLNLEDNNGNMTEIVVDYKELCNLKAFAEEKKRFTFIRREKDFGALNVYSEIKWSIVCNKV